MSCAEKITVDGVDYFRQVANGRRAVVVVDRGWIFAGDVTREKGRICLTRAIHVFSWPSGGFAAMVADPKKIKADLRPCSDVHIPEGAEVFSCPVSDNWGL